MPVDLLRPLTPAAARGLADWTWVPGITELQPWLVTACADVVLQGDDGLWFLSTVDGSLEREWADVHAPRAAVADVEGADRYLHAWLVEGAVRRGLEPGPEQSLVLVPAPAVGGRFHADDLQVYDTSVALSLSGQLHRQLAGGGPR